MSRIRQRDTLGDRRNVPIIHPGVCFSYSDKNEFVRGHLDIRHLLHPVFI